LNDSPFLGDCLKLEDLKLHRNSFTTLRDVGFDKLAKLKKFELIDAIHVIEDRMPLFLDNHKKLEFFDVSF
jgi:hypothetical protein